MAHYLHLLLLASDNGSWAFKQLLELVANLSHPSDHRFVCTINTAINFIYSLIIWMAGFKDDAVKMQYFFVLVICKFSFGWQLNEGYGEIFRVDLEKGLDSLAKCSFSKRRLLTRVVHFFCAFLMSSWIFSSKFSKWNFEWNLCQLDFW